MKQGWFIVGVKYSDNFSSAEYCITNSADKVEQFKGSKYIRAESKGIFQQIQKCLMDGERVFFVGLPCMVAALYNFLGYRPENLLTCDLICHGPTEKKIHAEYVRWLEKKFSSRLVFLNVRYKKQTWRPPYLYAEFENGKRFLYPFYETEYGYGFSVLAEERCYNCSYKGENRAADITMGDFWGATENDAFWNSCGVSAICTYTAHGDEYLKRVPNLVLFPVPMERITKENPMYLYSRDKHCNRDKFKELLNQRGLIYAVHNCGCMKQKFSWGIRSVMPRTYRCVLKLIKGG